MAPIINHSSENQWSEWKLLAIGIGSTIAAISALFASVIFLCACKKRKKEEEDKKLQEMPTANDPQSNLPPQTTPVATTGESERTDSAKDSDKDSSGKSKEPTIYDTPPLSVKAVYDFTLDLYRVAFPPYYHRPERCGYFPIFPQTVIPTRAVSPLAIQAAMYPCYMGAGGRTKDEIRQVLYPRLQFSQTATGSGSFKNVDEYVREVASTIDGPSSKLAEVNPFEGFSMALRVYAPANRYQYSAEFYDQMNKRGCRLCDFVEFRYDAAVGQSRTPLPLETFVHVVNHFVHGASKRRIESPLTEELIKEALYMPTTNTTRGGTTANQKPPGMLVFAYVRVRCNWTHAFQRDVTFKAIFDNCTPNSRTFEVEMMKARSKAFRYYEDEHCRIVQLHLAEEKSHANFYVIMPTVFNLIRFENWLTGEKLLQILVQCRQSSDVEVNMPRMFVESKLTPTRMNNCLRQLGLKTTFEPQHADFTPMIERHARQSLHVAAVIHDARIEASDDTCATPNESFDGPPKKVFSCNAPFMFVVSTGRLYQIPILIGRYGGLD